MQRGFVTQMTERPSHFREEKFRLVAQAEERFGAAEFLSRAGDSEDFFRSHGMCAGFPGITAENAVATVVAAQVGERQENLAPSGSTLRASCASATSRAPLLR